MGRNRENAASGSAPERKHDPPIVLPRVRTVYAPVATAHVGVPKIKAPTANNVNAAPMRFPTAHITAERVGRFAHSGIVFSRFVYRAVTTSLFFGFPFFDWRFFRFFGQRRNSRFFGGGINIG